MESSNLLYCYGKLEFDEVLREGIPNNTAFISICGNNGEDHFFKEEALNVINLNFDDISEDIFTVSDGSMLYGLSDNDARRLAEFIDLNLGRDFYIHCQAGQSRSQGVVRYILDSYPNHQWKLRESNPCLTPNLYVTAKLKRAYRELFLDIAELIRESGWLIGDREGSKFSIYKDDQGLEFIYDPENNWVDVGNIGGRLYLILDLLKDGYM